MICTSTGLAKIAARHAVAGTGLEREARAVAGGAGIEHVDGIEIGLVARERECRRRAIAPRLEIGGSIERQQHGHGAAGDAGEELRGDRVELHQRRHRARIVARHRTAGREDEVARDRGTAVDLGAELVERCAPIDAQRRERGAAEFVRSERSGGEERKRRQKQRDEAETFPNHCLAPRRHLFARFLA